MKSAVERVDVVIAVSCLLPFKLIEMQGKLKKDLTMPMTYAGLTGWARWTRRKRWKILLIIVLVLIAGWFVSHRHLDNQIAAEIQQIQDQGHPVTLVELEAWYPFPEGKNAADVYATAFTAQVDDPVLEQLLPGMGDARWPIPGETLADDSTTAMSQYVHAHVKTLRLLQEASEIKDCRYPIDIHAGLARLHEPYIGDLKDAAALLAMYAHLQVTGRRYLEAVNSINALLRLSDSLKNEPIFLSYMVYQATRSQVCQTLEYLLGQGRWPKESLDRLAEIFDKKWDARDVLTRAIVGERCDGLDAFDSFHNRESDSGRQMALRWYQRSVIFKFDKLTYLRLVNDMTTHLTDPLLNCDDFEIDLGLIPIYSPITRILIPQLRRAIVLHNRVAAQGRTMVVGIAAKRALTDTGQLPTQLIDLVPKYLDAVPVDPFDGQSLRYQLSEDNKQATIYSVGDDLTDNHGTRLNLENRPYKDGTDIVFVVE